jgi:SAM-dependent methyltransferase
VSTKDKYAGLADGFAEHEYADPARYSARRAEVIAGLGPPVQRGDTVLDLCCADGIMAAPLTALGLVYSGVDVTEEMLAAAARRNPGLEFTTGRIESFEPSRPVDVTVCLRSFYLAEDRVAFFRRVRGYTRKKFVFDFRPVAFPADEVVSQLEAAGFTRIELRPFFLPQRRTVPAPALPLLSALERTGPVARTLTRRFGCMFCSASA